MNPYITIILANALLSACDQAVETATPATAAAKPDILFILTLK